MASNHSGKPPPSDYIPAFTSYDSFSIAAIGIATPKKPTPPPNNHRSNGGWFEEYTTPRTPKPTGTPTAPARKPSGW